MRAVILPCYDLGTGRETLLTDGGRSQNRDLVWSTAGDRIAYGSTRRNGTDRDLYVINPSEPESDTVVMQGIGGDLWIPLDWSPDDSQILVLEYVSVTRSTLWLLDVATGRKRTLTDSADRVAWCNAAAQRCQFAADGRGVYVTSDTGSEFLRLGYLELSSSRFTPLTTDIPWDVEAFDVSRDGGTIAFVVNEAGVSTLHLLNTASRRHRAVDGVPRGVITGLRWHRNNRDVGFSVANANAPSDVYSIDALTGALSRWTEAELGGLVPSDLVAPDLISWKSFDGRDMSGF